LAQDELEAELENEIAQEFAEEGLLESEDAGAPVQAEGAPVPNGNGARCAAQHPSVRTTIANVGLGPECAGGACMLTGPPKSQHQPGGVMSDYTGQNETMDFLSNSNQKILSDNYFMLPEQQLGMTSNKPQDGTCRVPSSQTQDCIERGAQDTGCYSCAVDSCTSPDTVAQQCGAMRAVPRI
jgi:hypothetical protein